MPTRNSFFNILEDIKDRFPTLSRKELITLGAYIWKQLTWEEKYPYMVKAWRSKKKNLQAQKPNDTTIEIKLDFLNRLKKHAAEKSSVGIGGGIVKFLKIMSTKVWDQLLLVAMESNADVTKKDLDRPYGALRLFYRQMRRQRRMNKTQKQKQLQVR